MPSTANSHMPESGFVEGDHMDMRSAKHADQELEQLDLERDGDEVKREAQKTSNSAAQHRVIILVTCHALCASGLLVVNKWALKVFPFVWTLTTVQFLFAAIVAYLAGKLKLIEVDALDIKKLRQFFPAAGMFFITITAGNAVVGVSNVDTFIVMRSVVPIPCAILESIVLKEPYPAPASWMGLLLILLGACVYCAVNQGVVVVSVAWVILYLALMPLDGVLIKHLVSASGLTPWGLVLYNNVCALLPGIFFSILIEMRKSGTRDKMLQACAEHGTLFAISLTCLSGLAISYFQLNVRKVISSTAFMVLGVSNKLLSVLLNQFSRLDTNNSLYSVGSVLLSIFGAIFFQQTVKGKGISQAPKQKAEGSETAASAFVVLGVLAAAAISIGKDGG
eukprot:TRINITY_DN87330_c0_g1_i1.p1 TRINITY_DN87330_c0_g1~~TRINITY_DN87330_c0_g1_i1.p1  ORF type:complete len:405 (-),score=65.91 TRINITY_DN87330_c0_g1_i1:248-1426(-)